MRDNLRISRVTSINITKTATVAQRRDSKGSTPSPQRAMSI
jgi:hypothetical protein